MGLPIAIKTNKKERSVKLTLHFALCILVFPVIALAQPAIKNSERCRNNYKVGKIPRVVKQTIKQQFGKRFAMANPGKIFQSSDIIRGRIRKERRLVFWANCPNELFLIYEHGGYAYHIHAIVFKREYAKYRIIKNIFVANSGVGSIREIESQLNDSDTKSFDHF